MWEVDPETKSKLLTLQKLPGNTTCVDCNAPSPQWASPKFGTFICLSCAGLHRGLGVHISFVRSISMDSFKVGEVKRMELAGNKAWKAFWVTQNGGSTEGEEKWERAGVEGRYTGDLGDEWKERLSAKVENREFVSVPKKEPKKTISRTTTPISSDGGPPQSTGPRKQQNEAYFSKLGNENASRPASLPPNQGGKYGGFGSAPSPSAAPEKEGGIPGVDEFQQDPVAALTKGFGWFSAAVGKSAKSVNEGWIQPTAQKISSSELTSQARLTAAQVAQNATKATQNLTRQTTEQFNKFVEGDTPSHTSRTVEPEKKDFWDSFGGGGGGNGGGGGFGGGPGGGTGKSKSGAIGTTAMKSGNSNVGSAGGRGGGGGTTAPKDEGWEEW